MRAAPPSSSACTPLRSPRRSPTATSTAPPRWCARRSRPAASRPNSSPSGAPTSRVTRRTPRCSVSPGWSRTASATVAWSTPTTAPRATCSSCRRRRVQSHDHARCARGRGGLPAQGARGRAGQEQRRHRPLAQRGPRRRHEAVRGHRLPARPQQRAPEGCAGRERARAAAGARGAARRTPHRPGAGKCRRLPDAAAGQRPEQRRASPRLAATAPASCSTGRAARCWRARARTPTWRSPSAGAPTPRTSPPCSRRRARRRARAQRSIRRRSPPASSARAPCRRSIRANALPQQISGSVVVQYTVDARGETRDVRVVEATPPGVFDKAAINAVRHWRYAPTLVNGTPRRGADAHAACASSCPSRTGDSPP